MNYALGGACRVAYIITWCEALKRRNVLEKCPFVPKVKLSTLSWKNHLPESAATVSNTTYN